MAKIPNKKIITKTNDVSMSSLPKTKVSKKEDERFSKTLYLFLITVPIALSLTFFFLKKRKVSDGDKKNIEFKKKENKKAVLNEIESAELALQTNQIDKFYASLQQSIFLVCLGETVNDSKTIFNKADLLSVLENKKIDSKLMDEVKTIFTICEGARYGLNLDEMSHDQLYALTKKTIEDLMIFLD